MISVPESEELKSKWIPIGNAVQVRKARKNLEESSLGLVRNQLKVSYYAEYFLIHLQWWVLSTQARQQIVSASME